ncbi:MAG: AsnC family transcriptional regulator [Thermoproteota archaeon]|nr:AsnC family transcriptional regulator [Thermoproteota archaeon]
MPIQLDGYDVAILRALLMDGRKSFRQVSRETGISTPTVKARFERLVNVGFIKAVIPIIDFEKVQHNNSISDLQTEAYVNQNHHNLKKIKSSIKKGLKIMMSCDFCHGSIAGDPEVLKFANYERFFCCT